MSVGEPFSWKPAAFEGSNGIMSVTTKETTAHGREIDYEVDGVNLDFNHYGVVNFKTPFSAEKQLCLSCAARVRNFVENSAKMDGGDSDAAD